MAHGLAASLLREAALPAIDLRSDTVTLPTAAMREAMAAADVGDDVFGEDPTINRLESVAAARLGKEAALFVPSGTMANLVALLTHTQPGDAVILGEQAHIVRAEVGGAARLGGLLLSTLPEEPDGGLDPDQVLERVRVTGAFAIAPTLLALENTHNFCGGTVQSAERVRILSEIAHDAGLRVHMDGARIFNAAIASGTDAADLAASADTVCFCLSKGLSAPVGSLICGPAEFIGRARRVRRMVGGGMRQAGVLAAAGLVALETMVDRLAEDHANARRLAEGLRGLGLAAAAPETNIVVAVVEDAAAVQRRLEAGGVRITVLSPTRARLVTHYGIEAADIETALVRIGDALGGVP